MATFRRIWQKLVGETPEIPYVDETKAETISMKDMLRFMESQSSQQTELMKMIAQASVSQAKTMETYIDLFKPRHVESTSLSQREEAQKVKIRESEWEGIMDPAMFNEMTSAGIPPEPSEY